jgi:UDP-N-acetylmuramyl pentapeptide phosphotransferase/UDP-N-acetylglucosamine-1-phosphate transferase
LAALFVVLLLLCAAGYCLVGLLDQRRDLRDRIADQATTLERYRATEMYGQWRK